MKHLSEEQFEGLLEGRQCEGSHLGHCQVCQGRLAEKRAIRARLQTAFASIHAPQELADQISRQTGSAAADRPEAETAESHLSLRLSKRIWQPLAAAAAVLAFAVPLGIYLTAAAPAAAAQAQLVSIHEHNISEPDDFYADDDPTKLADYLKEKLGFTPAFPRLGQGMSLRGCCLSHFREQIVGSYVVNTPRGIVSIIVVADRPRTLGLGRKFQYAGQTFWAGTFAKCNMVTLRLKDYSYCAVGELSLSHEVLSELLGRLVSEQDN